MGYVFVLHAFPFMIFLNIFAIMTATFEALSSNWKENDSHYVPKSKRWTRLNGMLSTSTRGVAFIFNKITEHASYMDTGRRKHLTRHKLTLKYRPYRPYQRARRSGALMGALAYSVIAM